MADTAKMPLWDVICEDLARTFHQVRPLGTRERALLVARGLGTVKGLAIIGLRLSQRVGARSNALGMAVKQVTQAITGADIGHRAGIGPGLRIYHPSGIVVSETARLGSRCTIQSCSTIAGRTVIGDDVTIGPGARVLPDVRIADGCHVGANAVVTRTIPGESMVLVGAPAAPLRDVDRSSA